MLFWLPDVSPPAAVMEHPVTWMRMGMQSIDNWSPGLDWKILLLTIPKVPSGKGAR
jgi:lipopolysaccharide/colanic/teichoic acid biosynthesis glycosyltransferase